MNTHVKKKILLKVGLYKKMETLPPIIAKFIFNYRKSRTEKKGRYSLQKEKIKKGKPIEVDSQQEGFKSHIYEVQKETRTNKAYLVSPFTNLYQAKLFAKEVEASYMK